MKKFIKSCFELFLLSLILGVIGSIFTWAWKGAKNVLGIPTPTPYVKYCHRWEEINSTMIGKEECFYGTIVGFSQVSGEPTLIEFSDQPNTFVLIDNSHKYPDLKIGECVQSFAVVKQSEDRLYMELSDLRECNYEKQ